MLRIVIQRFEQRTEPTIDIEPEQIIDTETYRNGDIEVQYWEEVDESQSESSIETGNDVSREVDEGHICGYEKDDGERCQITVSGPDGRCHYHE